jgi:hypothetical protein
MTKKEFMEYLGFLGKTLSIDVPKDKEVIAIWYKSFENTHLAIAKNMAELYLQNESGYFKLAKLLEYKSRAMASKMFLEEAGTRCDLCDDTGFLVFREKRPDYPIEIDICRRCVCHKGDKLPNNIRQMTGPELEEYGQTTNKVFTKGECKEDKSISESENFDMLNQTAVRIWEQLMSKRLSKKEQTTNQMKKEA